MGRPEKPVDASGGAVAEFASRLRRLRAEAGGPTYRDMAKAAMYSASVLSSAANGHRLPTLQVALAYAAACGGDREEWRRRWLEAAAGGIPALPPRPAAAPGPPIPREPAAEAIPSGLRPAAPVLPRPCQLPPRPRGLVGRRTELGLLASAPPGPVVISGPAGVGKSELALHHAHELAPAMVDGQLYADLGPAPEGGYDVPGLLAEFLTALGVPAGRIPAAADQRAGLYRSLLAQRRVLVLLENVHSERQVRPLLADSATSTTIVVGRSSLLGLRDVLRVRLDLLPRTDSVALISRGLPERAQADPASADRLAELCGDLPLALDIAARKLLAHPEMSLRWAVARLERPEALLDWLTVGDLSLREVLASAHARLGDEARELLDRLTLLPQPELRTDESILAGSEHLTDELVEAGMLRHTERLGAYRLDALARALVTAGGTAYDLPPRHSVPFTRVRPLAGARQLT
ncbi:helix-turn-helix domain-containing protein [Streptomyces sp. NPDC005017]|uniref:helix-turn-helix domain-containing protein n=1 Tax=Streptomyces sp. NPDC005017 TaxID=3364706 RepID=UPI0036917B42